MSARRIATVDCEYVKPRFAAAYLLVDPAGSAAFVDNGTAHSVPLLLQALRAEGLTPEQVEWLIVTHVHLDHAGGTTELARACPRARILAHPRAARHLIDPSRLVASARQVYGDQLFDRMYGRDSIAAIDAARVRAVDDGEAIAFGGGAPLRFLHTRGHANHHFCIYEPESRSVFTGDSFGLAYPRFQSHGTFVFASTSPTDFDSAEALASVDKILATGATTAYPTHFGPLTGLAEAAVQLRDWIRFSQRLLDEGDAATFEARLTAEMERRAKARGLVLSDEDRQCLAMDLRLNAQGLAYVLAHPKLGKS